VRIWSATTGELEKTLQGHTNIVNSVEFSPDGERVASGSHDCTVRIWNATTGTLEKTLEGHTHWVFSVAFSPDGQHVASGSFDRTVRIWPVGDVATFVKTRLDGWNEHDETHLKKASEHLRSLYGEAFRTFHEQLWNYVNKYRADLRGNMFALDRSIEEHIMKEQVEHDWTELNRHLKSIK